MEKYKNKVTLIVCTCKRINSFIPSMKNFFENCLDHHLIYQVIVFDDNSSDDDRNYMLENYPDFKFIFKKYSEKGHSKSLNMIPKYVTTKYFLNWEDDTEFKYPKNYITDAIDILESQSSIDNNIVQVLFNDSGFSYQQKNNNKLHKREPVPHIIHKIKDDSLLPDNANDFIIGIHHWPGYSDNAYIMHTDIINKLGGFINDPSYSEVDFSIKFRNNRFKTCYLIGSGLKWNSGESAYVLNGMNRWWDNIACGVEFGMIKYIATNIFKFQTWITVWNIITGKV